MSSTLDSVAAFSDRDEQIGVDRWIVDKLVEKKFATFGRLAFAFPYSPQTADDTAFKRFLAEVLGDALSDDQMATLRRLFFESHTMALTDVRLRSESSLDPSQKQSEWLASVSSRSGLVASYLIQAPYLQIILWTSTWRWLRRVS